MIPELRHIETTILRENEYYLPKDINEVVELVKYAADQKIQVRTQGSGHSVREALSASERDGKPGINILLSRINNIAIDPVSKSVRVGAGRHLGGKETHNPRKLRGGFSGAEKRFLYSKPEKVGLFSSVANAGFAFPDTGGISHQTVGGFLSTGSSGSSNRKAFNECLLEVTIVTANPAEAITLKRSDINTSGQTINFEAVGTSLGLLGIIVEAVFELEENYNVKGKEVTSKVSDCEINLGQKEGNSKQGLADFLLTTEYKRLMLWPQPEITKVSVWQAERIPYSQSDKLTPYKELAVWQQFVAHLFFTTITGLSKRLSKAGPEKYRKISEKIYNVKLPRFVRFFLKDKITIEEFCDTWYNTLPMDNKIHDRLLPIQFTELWIDVAYTKEVMKIVNQVFKTYYENYPGTEGIFSTEIYLAKESKFWLSPAYEKSVIRIDIFCFGDQYNDKMGELYKLFWDVFEHKKIYYRPHWGKHLDKMTTYHWRKRYPKWDEFMTLRKQHDPHDIFLNDYWKEKLDL